jgi:hypothetical protein
MAHNPARAPFSRRLCECRFTGDRDRAEPGLDTELFFADPEAYSGKTVILGDVISSSRNAQDGTYIKVLQKPLDYRGIPEDTDVS